MSRSKYDPKYARKRNPLLLGHEPLALGDEGVDMEEILLLTPQQAADEFLSRWMETVDPIVKYKRYFTETVDVNSHEEMDRALATIKRLYRACVVEVEWDEYKFVTVLDHLLSSNMALAMENMAKAEELYIAGRCAAQLKEKRLKGRRRI